MCLHLDPRPLHWSSHDYQPHQSPLHLVFSLVLPVCRVQMELRLLLDHVAARFNVSRLRWATVCPGPPSKVDLGDWIKICPGCVSTAFTPLLPCGCVLSDRKNHMLLLGDKGDDKQAGGVFVIISAFNCLFVCKMYCRSSAPLLELPHCPCHRHSIASPFVSHPRAQLQCGCPRMFVLACLLKLTVNGQTSPDSLGVTPSGGRVGVSGLNFPFEAS